MNPVEAAQIINGMVFKPGWHVYATAGASQVTVWFAIDTVDTSYPDPATGDCRRQVTLERSRTFSAADLDTEGLCYQVLKLAAETDSHENREFLKIRRADGSWHAPLHPHTEAGVISWHEARLSDPDLSDAQAVAELIGALR